MSTHTTHAPGLWYAETPILIETLASSVKTTVMDVCEHLEANVTEAGDTENGAVLEFIDEYIAA